MTYTNILASLTGVNIGGLESVAGRLWGLCPEFRAVVETLDREIWKEIVKTTPQPRRLRMLDIEPGTFEKRGLSFLDLLQPVEDANASSDESQNAMDLTDGNDNDNNNDHENVENNMNTDTETLVSAQIGNDSA